MALGVSKLNVASFLNLKKCFLILATFLPNRQVTSMPKTSGRAKLFAEVDHLIWLHSIHESILDDDKTKVNKEKDERELLDIRFCIYEN